VECSICNNVCGSSSIESGNSSDEEVAMCCCKIQGNFKGETYYLIPASISQV
jgi:hypothetical protein